MIYFWIIGLFLVPFVLKPVNRLDPKQNSWNHPLFFLLFVFAIFQAGLSWFTLLSIPSYEAYKILAALLLTGIVVSSAIYVFSVVWRTKEQWTLKTLLALNKSSFLGAGVLLVALIVLVSCPQINIFSDTNGYISISSYFQNGEYTFSNDSSTLAYFYRLSQGYYLNGAFASRDEMYAAYFIVWPLIIFYLFYWTIDFFAQANLPKWKEATRLFFTGFVNAVYLALAFCTIYMFSSGNYEVQALFVLITIVLGLTKKIHYFVFAFSGFGIFSITGTLVCLPFFGLAFLYLLVKKNWLGFFNSLAIGTHWLLLLVAFAVRDSQAAYAALTIAATAAYFVLLGLVNGLSLGDRFMWLRVNIVNQTLADMRWPRVAAARRAFNDPWTTIAFYCLSFAGTFLCTKYLVLDQSASADNIMLLYAAACPLFGIYLLYAIYSKARLGQTFPIAKWLTGIQSFYVVYTLAIGFGTDLFVTNGSMWRVILTSGTIGFVCTYVGLVALMIAYAVNDHLEYFTVSMFRHKRSKRQRVLGLNLALTSAVVAASGLTTGLVWNTRIDVLNQNVAQPDGQFSRKWFEARLADANDPVLEAINQLQIVKVPQVPGAGPVYRTVTQDDPQEQKPKIIPHSYYSDIALTLRLSNLYTFSYGEHWRISQYNNFVYSDAWMKIMQNASITDLFYENVPNAVANIDEVIGQAVSNIANDRTVTYPTIARDADKAIAGEPIQKGMFWVEGAPDFLIFNKNTDYYPRLAIAKKLAGAPQGDLSGFVYSQADFDPSAQNNVNLGGYQFLTQTPDTVYFYNNKTIALTEVNEILNAAR